MAGMGPGGMGGPGQVSQSQLQQGTLVLVPNPLDPNGPPQLVLQIPTSADSGIGPGPAGSLGGSQYHPTMSPVLSALGAGSGPGGEGPLNLNTAMIPPMTPTRAQPAGASPGSSPPSIDTTPQPPQQQLLHGMLPRAIGTSPSLAPLPPVQAYQPNAAPGHLPQAPPSYPPITVPGPISARPATSLPQAPTAPSPQPGLPPLAPRAAQAAPLPVPAPIAAAPKAAAAAPAEDTTFLCDYHCGFSGGFEAVSMHENNCAYNPKNGGSGDGLAEQPPKPGLAQPAYSKRMRLSQQVTPMTPVTEGGEDEDE